MCSHFHEQCWVQLPANALSQHFGGDEVGGAVSLDLGILPEEGPEHEVGAAVSLGRKIMWDQEGPEDEVGGAVSLRLGMQEEGPVSQQ